MDGLGLLAAFIDGQDQAAVEQFFVDVDGSGGQKDHGRAFDMVFFGFHASLFICRVGNRQLAFDTEFDPRSWL